MTGPPSTECARCGAPIPLRRFGPPEHTATCPNCGSVILISPTSEEPDPADASTEEPEEEPQERWWTRCPICGEEIQAASHETLLRRVRRHSDERGHRRPTLIQAIIPPRP